MESLFLESVVEAVVNYNSTILVVYQQMSTIMIFIFVIMATIEFKLSLKTFNTSLNLVKIFFTALVTSSSTKTISLS